MRIIIVGAGEVGSSIAASLSKNHEIVVVDTDPQKVEDLTYTQDILAIEGDGASLSTLESAGVGDADMLIASTDDDETNLVTCSTAKAFSDAFTIARVRNAEYLNTWGRSEGAFGVDFMVSVNLLTADDVTRVVGLPAARDVDSFAGGLVQMAEFEVSNDSVMTGRTISQADRFDDLTFAAIARNDEVTIPNGETVIRAGDKLIVIGRPESVQACSEALAEASAETNEIVIVGGTDIGCHTAKSLEARGLSPRLIEHDPERARSLAEELAGTLILEHNATDIDSLLGEHVDQTDVVIAATDSDERNLLVSLLAKDIGVPRTVAIVEEGKYAELFEAVGVDVAINPRQATAEEIIRFTEGGQIENLSLIEGRQAEVLEFEVDERSTLTGRRIQESTADLPAEVVVGAITRGREFVVPRGDTVIESGDHVVLFVAASALSEVMAVV